MNRLGMENNKSRNLALSLELFRHCLESPVSVTMQPFHRAGQPTELALLVVAAKLKVPDPRPQYHRMQEIPFTSDRKRMEVRARPLNNEHSCAAFKQAVRINGNSSDGSLYFVKGMPDAVLGECESHIAADGSAAKFTDIGRRRVLSQSRRMAASGLRILAMAYGHSLEDLTFAGVVGMEDPPREGYIIPTLPMTEGGISSINCK